MNNVISTLPVTVIEEIGFEGLEGITIEGLWKRIGVRMKLTLPLRDRFKNETWTFVLSTKCFSFYLLPVEREPLIIYDRMEYADNTGPIELDTCPYNVYKYNPIRTDEVRGSCQHFDAREEIPLETIAELSIDAVEEKYGLRFVIVAAQSIRNNLLIPRGFSTDAEISISMYCILERLGRARYNGELNQGKYSLSDIVGDPVMAYSYKKKLKRHKLIECQVFHQNIDGTNTFSQLFHLPRFFSKYKSRIMQVMERIVELLKSKPNCMAEYQEIRGMFDENIASTLRRLVRSPLFHKIVINDPRFPFRAIYPNATEDQWKMKNRPAERTLHVLQLRDSNVDFDEMWAEQGGLLDDDDDVNYSHQRGFLDVSHEVLEIPLLHQVYQYIGTTKEEGVSEFEVGQNFGQSKLSVRSIIRKFLDEKIIDFYTTTRQRQSVRRYHWTEYKTEDKNFDLIADSDLCSTEQLSSEAPEVIQVKGEDTSNNVPNEAGYESIEYVPIADLFNKTENDDGFPMDVDEKQKEISDKVSMKITEINKTDHCSRSKQKPLTATMLSKRSNERLRYIHRDIESKIIYGDPSLLYTAIVQDEASRGLTDKLCRKTFFRLLSFMRSKRLIRLWRVEFKYQSKFRNFLYMGSKKADVTFPLMKSYLEQAKAKFIMSIIDEKHRIELHKLKRGISKFSATSDDKAENQSTKDASNNANVPIKRERLMKRSQLTPSHSSNYGINPKFIRLRTLHEFLFYLVYAHRKNADLNQTEMIGRLEADAFDTADIETMPHIWSDGLSWKTFIPPLIPHDGFPNGWCLVSDCIFRMPLSVFIRIVNYAYKIRGLDEILTHPIKKHFLLQDLPVHIQQALFMGRKYIASISYQLQRLCCLGLLQVGPHRIAKDQAYFFVNHAGKLNDTSSSEQGLHFVSDKEYPEAIYKFDTLDDVMTYWDDMYSICMSTKLNRRSMGDGTTPAEKVLPERLLDCLRPIQPQDVDQNTVLYLPGDHRGAAGMDSYFFSHLERNWSFNVSNFWQKQKIPRHISEKALATIAEAEPIRCSRLVRTPNDAIMKRSRSSIKTVPLHKLKTAVLRRRAPVVRKKKATVARSITTIEKRKRNKYDEIDRIALQHMKKLRVDWNDEEDSFLLLCRVAQMYLNSQRVVMPPHVVRDLLHWKCNSVNKTSLACRRRVTYIMKNLPQSRQIVDRMTMCLNEIKQTEKIRQRFGDNFIDRLKKVYANDKEFGEAFRVHFVDLVFLLSQQFYNLTNIFESNWLVLPNTIDEFRARFVEKTDASHDPEGMHYDRVESIEDISLSTIITLIHSTMCCCYDRTSFSIQLYEVYKDFPEMLLTKAMAHVRSDQLISHNKLTAGIQKAHNRCLPLSSKTYHLSVSYQQQMTTKINYDLYVETFALMTEVFGESILPDDKYPFGHMNSGACFLLSELTRFDDFEVQIDIPERILLLDPSTRSSEEVIRGIRDRFHEIINYLPKMDLEETMDYDIFPAPLPDSQEDTLISTKVKALIQKLDTLPANVLHFFCIIDIFGESKPLAGINMPTGGNICSLNCLRNATNPYEGIMDKLLSKRDVWTRLNAEQQQNVTLTDVVNVGERNIVAIYSRLLLKGAAVNEEKHTEHLNQFKQLLDIVDVVFEENDTELIDENFEARYDPRGDVRKRMFDGAQINEKIHKFQDFLNVNTCKLSLVPKNGAFLDLIALNAKRNSMVEEIVRDCNWSSDNRINALKDIFHAEDISSNQFTVIQNIFEFIEERGEIGATAEQLRKLFVDKVLLQNVLSILNKAKLVMRTGVGDLTFVHWKYIKPWIVNTYHLKRLDRVSSLDRESIQPTTKHQLEIAEQSPTKRKASTDAEGEPEQKRNKIDDNESETISDDPIPKDENHPNDQDGFDKVDVRMLNEDSTSTEPVSSQEGPKPSIRTKRRNISIQYGEELDPQFTPKIKNTFPLKMAPWIRVNGSVNRRVLDKYAGTVLLHCIENVGTTLHSLCTRFHYVFPAHLQQLIQYLEEFGCLTLSSLLNQEPATLFSEYKGVEIGSSSLLDDYKSIFIEPTLDAVTKMTIFIGDKVYKDDFI